MRPWSVMALAVFVACYGPTTSPGAPCADNGACPNGLVCAASNTCELAATDAANLPRDAPAEGVVPIDTAPLQTCWNAWLSKDPQLSPPTYVSSLNTSVDEGDPSLSGDALTLYFTRPGSGIDFFVASRPDRQSPFGAPHTVAELNSAADDTKVSLSADGRVAILSSKRDTQGSTDSNLYQATRLSPMLPFGSPSRALFPDTLDDLNPELDPTLSSDGLVLYYSTTQPVPGGQQHLQRSTRASVSAAFATPTQVVITNQSGAVADPVVSPDERVLLYTALTAGPTGTNADLYYAIRASMFDGFTVVSAVPVVATTVFEGDPELSRDGCELFFVSTRASGGSRDLYRSVVTPQ